MTPAETASVTLRFCFPDDRDALARLAALDDAAPPVEPVLLAEVAGEPRAALSLADGRVIADPFHRSIELVDLLRTREQQLRRAEHSRRRRLWLPLRARATAHS